MNVNFIMMNKVKFLNITLKYNLKKQKHKKQMLKQNIKNRLVIHKSLLLVLIILHHCQAFLYLSKAGSLHYNCHWFSGQFYKTWLAFKYPWIN